MEVKKIFSNKSPLCHNKFQRIAIVLYLRLVSVIGQIHADRQLETGLPISFSWTENLNTQAWYRVGILF